MGFLSKLLTLGEGKQLKRYEAAVQKINALEPSMQDLSDEELAAEFIREKILRNFFDEVPHAIGVAVEEMEFEKPNLYRIYAVIYVERDSQKGIIIGKRGTAIKRIGTEAREDLERLLGCRVYLDLQVKVKKRWRRDASQIRRFAKSFMRVAPSQTPPGRRH